MKKILATLLLMMTCTTHTIIDGRGRTTVCTTCCTNFGCTTTCT